MKGKKRGRKLTELNTYLHESEQKIKAQQSILDAQVWPNGKKLTEEERYRLRNRILALKARVYKKNESAQLYD